MFDLPMLDIQPAMQSSCKLLYIYWCRSQQRKPVGFAPDVIGVVGPSQGLFSLNKD